MKRKEKAAETEAALKAAAKRVFADRGYLSTKVTDITAEAGRAAGSFYNHFSGKEALLEALMADMAAESDLVAAEPGHLGDFTDPEAVRQHVAVYIRLYREHIGTIRAMEQAALVSEDFAAVLDRYSAAEMDDVLDHVTAVSDAGRVLPAPPEVSVRMAFGLVHTFLGTWRRRFEALDDEQVTDILTRFVYRGLNGRDY
ncbi:TetR/AcrR family transcriptional regulator [Streptomyces sp. ICBB 8177]|uniref:TetR/AcrR family transcriptional regulator n=1 Tax=Streptomyces sp. ICBB 8177 TaxID=563922 RepID=UPI000D68141B|nr:TetR/AcrR family transcriptional regulator [Streptomyces sp. ICBB 8177]PWI43021.1 TetR family transcriptional regulator [Streptomyces sp. ICBB 8177]